MSTTALITRRDAAVVASQPASQAAVVAPAHPLQVLRPPDVPLVHGGTAPYANFDYAASAPCARAAADAVAELLPRYAAVHRGAGWLSGECTRSYEAAREAVARFVGCRDDDYVVFTRHTTESLNLLAGVLPADTRVVVFESEHHANLLPWTNTVRLPTPDSPVAAVRGITQALEVLGDCAPVLVAVAGASNVTGELFPVAEIAAAARRHGARVLLDAAQLAPHRHIDIAALGVDYVALSGHKLYAPFGVGVLAGRSDWLDAASPHLAGGGAAAAVSDDMVTAATWKTGPARHEAGSPNVVGAVALAAVCRALSGPAGTRGRSRGVWDALSAREDQLRQRLSAGLARIPGVRQLHLFGADSERAGTVTFVVDGLPSGLAAAALSAEHGVGVRDGKFCAHPLTRRLLQTANGSHDQALRASIGLGSTEVEVDRLVEAVGRLATDGPRWSYDLVDGRVEPCPDPRVAAAAEMVSEATLAGQAPAGIGD